MEDAETQYHDLSQQSIRQSIAKNNNANPLVDIVRTTPTSTPTPT